MKKYIGTKQVNAEPMNLGEFIKQTGRNPYANSPEEHNDNEDGYIVQYEDGYKSWSPKNVFEKAYRVAETFIDRMQIERDELKMRFNKARDFYYSSKFNELTPGERKVFNRQFELMREYIYILDERIRLAETKLNTREPYETI